MIGHVNGELPQSISVVVATYNRPEHVRACLEHIEAQSRAADEVVVVDASPGVDTERIVGAFAHVRYLRNPAGAGTLSRSRSLGVTATVSEIVAFIDDDAYAEPTWLEELLSRYADASVGAVGGRARNGQLGEESEGLGQIGVLLPDGRLSGYFAADPGRDLQVDHFIGANFSVRRSALEAIGGIREYYPGTCLREESDIALRLGRAGYRIIYAPSAAVDHQPGPYAFGERFDLRYEYYAARNHVVLLSSALGWRDEHLRAYSRTAARMVVDHVRYGLKALRDPSRADVTDRLRGLARGITRATVVTAGTAAGSAASVRLALHDARSASGPN